MDANLLNISLGELPFPYTRCWLGTPVTLRFTIPEMMFRLS